MSSVRLNSLVKDVRVGAVRAVSEPKNSARSKSVVKKKQTELLCGDLFAGAGGLTVGFRDAGFKSVFFNEIEPELAETYRHNFSDAEPFICPIENLTAKQITKATTLLKGELDIMVGGPPCQGFSINAPLRSATDPRNRLFHHYVRLVLEGLRPKFIVLENVPGMVSFNGGGTPEAIKKSFEKAGYKVVYGILNAAHYGVPQERWRLVFIGTRLPDVELSLPQPTHYSLQRPNFSGGRKFTLAHAIRSSSQQTLFDQKLLPPTTIGEAIDDLPKIYSGGGNQEMKYTRAPKTAYQKSMRRESTVLYNHQCSGMSPTNQERLQHIKPGGSWRDIPYDLLPAGLKRARRSDHTKRYGRMDPKKPSGTIMTKCDPHWGTFFHYNQDRIISVREAARLHSFPDKFQFTGSMGSQYKQVGNAVPPLLARAIAEHVRTLITQS